MNTQATKAQQNTKTEDQKWEDWLGGDGNDTVIQPSQPTHSPLPWRTGDLYHTIFGPPNGEPCPEIIATVNRGNVKANAKFIVRACNNAERLSEALRKMLFNATHGNGLQAQIDTKEQAREALAQWEQQ